MVEAPEQCDDGDTIDGDGCSALCDVEFPDDCVAITEAEYVAEFGANFSFTAVLARADAFGYGATINDPVRCEVAGEAPTYWGWLGDSTNWAVLMSSDHVPEPMTTVLIRTTATSNQIVYASGAIDLEYSLPSLIYPAVRVLDGEGQEVSPTVAPRSDFRTCHQIKTEYDACFNSAIFSTDGWINLLTCSGAIATCTVLPPTPLGLMACLGTAAQLGESCVQSLHLIPWVACYDRYPNGTACRTENCLGPGTCGITIDNSGHAGWACTGATTPLCVAGETECLPNLGCVGLCPPCYLRDGNNACTINVKPSFSAVRWALLETQTKHANPCTCSGPNCSCGAGASFKVGYYGCANSGVSPGKKGTCGHFDNDTATGPFSCGQRPRDCLPDVLEKEIYIEWNSCGTNVCGSGEVKNCNTIRPVTMPMSGEPWDMRTPDEVRSRCCEGRPGAIP